MTPEWRNAKFGNANYFSAKNVLDCRILHIFSTFLQRWYPWTPSAGGTVLGPRHQFPLGLPAFSLFLFYETTTRQHNLPCTFPELGRGSVKNLLTWWGGSCCTPMPFRVPYSRPAVVFMFEAHKNVIPAGAAVRGVHTPPDLLPARWWRDQTEGEKRERASSVSLALGDRRRCNSLRRHRQGLYESVMQFQVHFRTSTQST